MKDERAFVLEKIQHIFPDLDAQAFLKQFEALGNPEIYRVAPAIQNFVRRMAKTTQIISLKQRPEITGMC